VSSAIQESLCPRRLYPPWTVTASEQELGGSNEKCSTASGTITDTICVANNPVTRAVADDLSGAFFDEGAFPGTLVKVGQRKIG